MKLLLTPFVSMTICLYMCGNAARPIRQHIDLTLCYHAVASVGSSECYEGAARGARQIHCASHGGCYLRQGASTGGQGALLTIMTCMYCLFDVALVKANMVLTCLLCPVSLLRYMLLLYILCGCLVVLCCRWLLLATSVCIPLSACISYGLHPSAKQYCFQTYTSRQLEKDFPAQAVVLCFIANAKSSAYLQIGPCIALDFRNTCRQNRPDLRLFCLQLFLKSSTIQCPICR